MKRLCLFAGYSQDGLMEDYVIYYVRELAKLADVYYMADCEMPKSELDKLTPHVISAQAFRHCKYDFGSWGKLYSHLQSILNKYDEVILTNDSIFGPLYSLENYFEKMSFSDCSAWSLCYNRFMMSFFVVLKPDIFLEKWFADFLTGIRPGIDKNNIVWLYESGMTSLIEQHGKNIDAVFKGNDIKLLYRAQKAFIRNGLKNVPVHIRLLTRWRTNKIRLYSDDYFILFLLKFPFIKKQAFSFNDNHFHQLAPTFIKKYTDYNYGLIEKSVTLNHLYPKDVMCLKYKLKRAIQNFFFEKRFKGEFYVYRICRITVWKIRRPVPDKTQLD